MGEKRKYISKGERFAVFNRDGFRCRYCGKTSVDVMLVVDHIVAVALGGDNSPDNLATSCVDCNAGKGTKPLLANVPGVSILSSCQSTHEEVLDLTGHVADMRYAIDLRAELDDLIREMWTVETGWDRLRASSMSRLRTHVREFGGEMTLAMLSIAVGAGMSTEDQIMRYVGGIAKNRRTEALQC